MDVNEKFDRIVKLELDLKGAKASIMFRTAGVSLYQMNQQEQSYQSAQTKLFAAIDTLTIEEMKMFGKYRTAEFTRRRS